MNYDYQIMKHAKILDTNKNSIMTNSSQGLGNISPIHLNYEYGTKETLCLNGNKYYHAMPGLGLI